MENVLGEFLLTSIFMAGNLVPGEFFKIQKLASAYVFPSCLLPLPSSWPSPWTQGTAAHLPTTTHSLWDT